MLAGKISFSYELVFLWYFKSQMGVDEAKNSQGWSVTFLSVLIYLCATVTQFVTIVDHRQNPRINNFKQTLTIHISI